jgi:hypothetical protein
MSSFAAADVISIHVSIHRRQYRFLHVSIHGSLGIKAWRPDNHPLCSRYRHLLPYSCPSVCDEAWKPEGRTVLLVTAAAASFHVSIH